MDHAMISRLYEILGPFAIDLKDEARALGTPTFLQIKALAASEWGHSTPAERDRNLDSISAKWHPSEGVKRLFRRAREAIAYSTETGKPIPDNVIVDNVLLVINQSQA